MPSEDNEEDRRQIIRRLEHRYKESQAQKAQLGRDKLGIEHKTAEIEAALLRAQILRLEIRYALSAGLIMALLSIENQFDIQFRSIMIGGYVEIAAISKTSGREYYER